MTETARDIVLVRMPYSEVAQPSLALGLLKAVCDRQGLSSRVVPAHLWFSEELGPALHDLIFEAYSTGLIGEWTFSGVLFPSFRPNDEVYLRIVACAFKMESREQWCHIQERYPDVDAVALLREVRRRAADFVARVADYVLAFHPKIVGCTSTFQQHCASLSLLRAIKQQRPDIVTMLGGANCEGDMGRTTFEQFPWLDFVVSGEADGFFGAMCDRLLTCGLDAVAPHHLPAGVWGPHHRVDQAAIRQVSADHVDGAPIAILHDMNESPVPNYDDYFAHLAETEELRNWIRPALPFQTARGCWWGEKTHCSFCGISRTAMKFRPKSSDNVLEQMIALRERYGIANFQGTEYIFDYRYFDTLLPRLKETGGRFRFEVKANLKPEQCQAFVDAGTLEVQPGVESLHDEALALLKKGVKAYQNLLLLKRARKVGLLVCWNLLYAIPGDRDEWYGEMADLVPLITHLQAPLGFGQIHYDRFSPYWRDPARFELALLPAHGYAYVYPFPAEVLEQMAYFFETPRQRERLYKAGLDECPGLSRLMDAVSAWNDVWRVQRTPPELVATDVGQRIVFKDTRAVAVAPTFEIDGVERRVYQAAEEGILLANLAKKLRDEAPEELAEQKMHMAIQSLVQRKILAHVSGRLLSLAVPGPVAPYLAHRIDAAKAELNPTWAKLKVDEALDQKRPNIAAWLAVEQPRQAPERTRRTATVR